MKQTFTLTALLLALATQASADTLYDLNRLGIDVVPSTGISRLLAGATVANPNVAASHIASPAASALTDRVVVAVGALHHSTNSTYRDQQQSSATTTFPALSVIIHLRVLNLFTGYFIEKQGRAALEADGIAYDDVLFDALYTKESSVFSVPIFVSAAYRRKMAVSGGVVFSYLDSRETRQIDFRSDEYSDVTDAMDMFASGTSWAFGALLDFDFVRVGGSVRTGTDMSGHEEFSTEISDIWKSRSVDLAAPGSYKLGAALVTRPLTVEFDYESSPWAKLKLDGSYMSPNDINRYALGITYTGRSVWNATRYPLMLGYYRQPLDRASPDPGESIEKGYLAGTSIGIAGDRAALVLGLEYITRKTDGEPDLHEEAFGFYVSVAIQEAWRRAIKR
jgi:hypothetical protein